jgi:hypothetical protein
MTIEADIPDFTDEDDHSLHEFNMDPFNFLLAQLALVLREEDRVDFKSTIEEIHEVIRFASRLGRWELVVLARKDLVEENKPGVVERHGKSFSEGLVKFSVPAAPGRREPRMDIIPQERMVKIVKLPSLSFILIPFEALGGIRLRKPLEENL